MWQIAASRKSRNVGWVWGRSLKLINKVIIVLCALFTIGGCSAGKGAGIKRLALVAPFEGRYGESGYDAYYAVRLAIQDRGGDSLELLAIDDGGSTSSAITRAKALASDPLVKAVITLGYNTTQPEAQQAFGNLPLIIVGQWQAKPTKDYVYMLASSQLESILTAGDHSSSLTEAAKIQASVIGGEIFALKQFPMLSNSLNTITIASSANIANPDFEQRYLSSGAYVPEPGLLATLSYDAAMLAIEAIQTDDVNESLAGMNYNGLNGNIQFNDGYWVDAPIHYYGYNGEGKLTSKDRPVK